MTSKDCREIRQWHTHWELVQLNFVCCIVRFLHLQKNIVNFQFWFLTSELLFSLWSCKGLRGCSLYASRQDVLMQDSGYRSKGGIVPRSRPEILHQDPRLYRCACFRRRAGTSDLCSIWIFSMPSEWELIIAMNFVFISEIATKSEFMNLIAIFQHFSTYCIVSDTVLWVDEASGEASGEWPTVMGLQDEGDGLMLVCDCPKGIAPVCIFALVLGLTSTYTSCLSSYLCMCL